MEGKEVRFGAAVSGLFMATTTGTSTGAINSWHDSAQPIAGLVPLFNMELGEITPGGIGAGMYGMLVIGAILAVFIAGLMVGRTPEFLGKKVEAYEIKMAMITALVLGASILGFTALASVLPEGTAGPLNGGPHGFSEILYAYSSQTGNNGSAFAGLSGNTPFYNITGAIAMLIGRYGMIIPILGLAGAMAAKRRVAPSLGTFPTTGVLWQAHAFLEAPRRHVGDETGMRVAQHFGGLGILGHFNDAARDGLLLSALQGEEQAALDAGLRHCGAFDNLDPRGPFHRAEILGGRLDLVVGHVLGELRHQVGVGLAIIRALAIVILEIVHGLDEIRDRQAGDGGVFGAALAVRIVAQRAREHVRRLAVRHDVGHRGVVAGEPVGWAVTVGDLLPGKLRRWRRAAISSWCPEQPGPLRARAAGFRGQAWQSRNHTPMAEGRRPPSWPQRKRPGRSSQLQICFSYHLLELWTH